MYDSAALIASVVSLALVLALYFSQVIARPGSLMQGETVFSLLLACLTGMFPLALAASILDLLHVVQGGGGMGALVSAGSDLISLGILVAVVLVFGATVRGARKAAR